MKTPTKFVKPLTDEQREQLKEIMKSQALQRKRMRAHAILLSERRYLIDQIADIYRPSSPAGATCKDLTPRETVMAAPVRAAFG
jgi:hypothetical protein